MNGTALTILEDFVRPFYPNLSDKAAAKTSKCISFSIGLIGYLLVFLISNVKTIFEVRIFFFNVLIPTWPFSNDFLS